MDQVSAKDMTLFSVNDVARTLGRKPQAVRKLARRRGIGRLIGHSYVFSEDDLEIIRRTDPRGGKPRRDGQPNQHVSDGSALVRRGRRSGSAPT